MKPPLPNSYWVEPGRLLAGEHPHGGDEALTRQRLEMLCGVGVRTFIDLTEPHELPSYRELLPAGVVYESLPLPDHSVPRAAQHMRQIQIALERALAAGGATYVHCRAGIGRTGITIGCYLREQGESPQAALVELNRLWQQNARAARWPTTPETSEQESYIRSWQVHPVDPAGIDESGLRRLALRPLQRYRGCFIGLAIGDALGSVAGASIAPLAWNDDAAMALCVAESLLHSDGFDGRDQIERYRAWERDPSAAGAAPDAQLRPVVKSVLSRAVWNRGVMIGSHDPTQLDPSPLARSAAAAMFAAGDIDAAGALGADVARVTHQAPALVDACRLFAAMLSLALAGAPRAQVLSADARLGGLPLRDDVRALAADWRAPTVGRRRAHRGVFGALDRAVRCFVRSRRFDDGMARALDSRDEDRDAICAAYGALAGSYYGEASIGEALRTRVPGLARIGAVAERLYGHGSTAHAPVG